MHGRIKSIEQWVGHEIFRIAHLCILNLMSKLMSIAQTSNEKLHELKRNLIVKHRSKIKEKQK